MKQLNHLVSELHSTPPKVPFAAGLNLSSFKDDSDPNPFFVELPLVQIGKKSKNGLLWDADASRSLVEQINTKRPGGNQGHIPKAERGHTFKLPALRWIGAAIVDGKVWGKAYVPANRPDIRAYFRDAKKVGAQVGTSVYGLSSSGLKDFQLESIDLGHPERVSNPASIAIPDIVSEQISQSQAAVSVQEPPLTADPKGDVEMDWNLYVHSKKEVLARKLRTLVSADQQEKAQAFDTEMTLADVRVVIAKLREEVVAGEQKLVKLTDAITRAVLSNKSTRGQEDERQKLRTRVADVKTAVERLLAEQQVASAREDVQRYEKALAALPKLLAQQEVKHEAAKVALRELRAAVQVTGQAFELIGKVGRKNGQKNPLEVERQNFEAARISLPDSAYMS